MKRNNNKTSEEMYRVKNSTINGESSMKNVNVVLVIACGSMIFVLLFLVSKRQIMRFAMRSRRGPHIPVGHNAPKELREEIDRRLSRVQELRWEPRLVSETDERLLKLNDLGSAYEQLKEVGAPARSPCMNLRIYLLDLLKSYPGVCRGLRASTVNAFASAYEHARYGTQEFGEQEYVKYMQLVNEISRGIQLQGMQHQAAARELGGSGTWGQRHFGERQTSFDQSAAQSSVQVTYLPSTSRTRRPKHFLELKSKDSYRTLESTM
uniref:protein C1orf43 homolog isoform X2 n=1 Tax=Myxine glutinosa TaxID=7769 RepID=UPI00358EB797